MVLVPYLFGLAAAVIAGYELTTFLYKPRGGNRILRELGILLGLVVGAGWPWALEFFELLPVKDGWAYVWFIGFAGGTLWFMNESKNKPAAGN